MSERDAYEDLYKTRTGVGNWYDSTSPEAQQWIDSLVDYVNERGQEPVWNRVLARFKELFPADAPKTPGTLSATVRRLRG